MAPIGGRGNVYTPFGSSTFGSFEGMTLISGPEMLVRLYHIFVTTVLVTKVLVIDLLVTEVLVTVLQNGLHTVGEAHALWWGRASRRPLLSKLKYHLKYLRNTSKRYKIIESCGQQRYKLRKYPNVVHARVNVESSIMVVSTSVRGK